MMKKVIIGAVLMLTILSLLGCITKEEKEKARKYMMEYVYVVEQTELRNEPYTSTFSFVPKYSSDRLRAELWYIKETPFIDNENIHKSLIGYSIEVWDQTTGQNILSNKITKSGEVYFSTASPSLFLTASYKVKRGHKYEIEIKVPAKKDTPDEYLKPTLVVGISEAPSL